MMMLNQINICKPCLPKFVEEKTSVIDSDVAIKF